jgi:pyruvate dehydrogenase E2 component (dihydrolipoamide acetyltransferase)
MATPVEAPKLGNTVEECIVSRWVKRAGDAVAAGDVVAEIETDKATFEVTAPVSGTVLATFFDEGSAVPVFTNLLVIGEPGEPVDGFRPGQSAAATAAAPAAAATSAPSLAAAPAVPPASAPYSPRARRFADEHNFHPSDVAGSGPGGRVLEQDLRALFDARPKFASGIRETIARRMRESLATTAQYTLHASADAAALLRAKAAANVSIGDLIAFCTVKALLAMPELNAEYVNGEIRQHSEIHLGFACDTPRGLLVPVVRNAHSLTLAELSARIKELAALAVAGRINPADLSGATFTISNLGALGIERFTPLLNPPQVAILGVGTIELKPVRRDGKVEFVDSIGLSLTCDHQAIDGAPGARFLGVLKEKIENHA